MPEREEDPYYFAGGERIPLKRARDATAVLLDHPAVAGLPEELRRRLERAGRPLTSRLVLIPCSVLPQGIRDRLDAAAALLPVFRHDDSEIVVLPEVRAEANNPAQVAAIRSFLGDAGVDPDRIEKRGTRLTFSPASGRGEDALRLGNALYERFRPALAQARFLRIVKKRGS